MTRKVNSPTIRPFADAVALLARATKPMAAAELADQCELGVVPMRRYLQALVEVGLVVRETVEVREANGPAYVFRWTA